MHIHGNRRQECVCDIAGGRRSWDPWDHWILVFLFNTRYSSCVVLHACLPSAQLCNFLLEFFGQQNFVRKAGVHEIEVIMDLAFFQSFGLPIIKVSWPFSHACQRSSSGTFDNPSQIFSKSARSVFARFSKGVAPTWSRMTIKIKVFSFLNETNLLSHKLNAVTISVSLALSGSGTTAGWPQTQSWAIPCLRPGTNQLDAPICLEW